MPQKERIVQNGPRTSSKCQVSEANGPHMATKMKIRPLTDFEKRLYEVKSSGSYNSDQVVNADLL